jgi:hypothetical protein
LSPIGISSPKDLISYFNKIQGKGVVSGEFIETGDPASRTIDPLNTLQAETGQFVGMIAIDYWHAGGSGAATTAAANADAIAQWKAGGLVEVNAAMPNPTTGRWAGDTSNLDVAGLLTPGTATNNALNANLSQVAAGLRQLQDAGVVVVYRPYWEMNGNWNWWGAGILSAQQFQALWQYTYNYMTDTMGLHNLVWMYAINAGTALPGRSLTDTYPGSSFVDMTGQDLYSNNPGIDGQSTYQALMALGKPTALAEFGPGGPHGGDPSFSMPKLISQIQAYMPNSVYWMQWWAQNSGGNGWGIEQSQNASAALNDGYVINRGQIVNSSGTPAPDAPKPPASPDKATVMAGSTASLTDASGNQWSITAGGQVAVNGVADSSTANVTELAYVGGKIWQENAGKLWWGKTDPTAAWGPSSGTATSPLPPASADNSTAMAGSTAVLTDANGNRWGITSGGQVSVNGVADTSTANVTELAYAGGKIWQENAGKLWWGKSDPAAAWGPSNGTATSPLPGAPMPKPSVSPENATVMAGSSSVLTDAGGNRWGITAGGQVAVNGVADTSTANVTELAYAGGKIWQENAGKLWWGKSDPAAAWGPSNGTATSPLPAAPMPKPVASPDDTTVMAGSTSVLTDAGGNRWSITAGGQVAVNGVADTSTAHVTELAYVGGTVWQENASKLWWGKSDPAAAWGPSSGTASSPLPASITIAADTGTSTISQSHVPVVANAGNHILFITGSGDTMRLSGGTETITDSGSGNTYVLPAAGKGFDTFTSDILTTSDKLDLRTALAATDWNGDAAALPGYLSVTNTQHGSAVLVSATAHATGVGIASMHSAGGMTLSDLLAHSITT